MGSEGTVKVISSVFGKKVQKNMDDYKGSFSIIRVGSAAGIEGTIKCNISHNSQHIHPTTVVVIVLISFYRYRNCWNTSS